MSKPAKGLDPTKCRPYHSMGTVWICNLRTIPDCPFALAFGYVHYCNNRSLHIT